MYTISDGGIRDTYVTHTQSVTSSYRRQLSEHMCHTYTISDSIESEARTPHLLLVNYTESRAPPAATIAFVFGATDSLPPARPAPTLPAARVTLQDSEPLVAVYLVRPSNRLGFKDLDRLSMCKYALQVTSLDAVTVRFARSHTL